MTDDKWKDIGFQGKNPRTDFRGGGNLGLLALLYMVDNYRAEFDTLAKCTKEDENVMWLTAITSINVTHSIVIYLHLNSDAVAPDQLKLRAGRTQFKKFCKLNSLNKRTFFELNCFGLRYVFKEWKKMIDKMGENDIVGLMGSFSTCMEETKKAIHGILSQRRINDFDHLVNAIEDLLAE